MDYADYIKLSTKDTLQLHQDFHIVLFNCPLAYDIGFDQAGMSYVCNLYSPIEVQGTGCILTVFYYLIYYLDQERDALVVDDSKIGTNRIIQMTPSKFLTKLSSENPPILNAISLPMSTGYLNFDNQLASDIHAFESTRYSALCHDQSLPIESRAWALASSTHSQSDWHKDAFTSTDVAPLVGHKLWIVATPKDPLSSSQANFDYTEYDFENDFIVEAITLGPGDRL